MAKRPEIDDYFLGAQENFNELGLTVSNYTSPEFSVADNECEIIFNASKPVKTTTTLIQCRDESKNLAEYVFTQRKGEKLYFTISFPESGYYKFQLFALPAEDESKSLPNVYNYLIKVERAVKAVYPFPKQYAQWKEGCYLYEPLILNSSSRLSRVFFKVYIPNAIKAAIVANGKDWNHLELKGDNFEGTFALDQYRNKAVKITLNACFGKGSSSYPTLLEYSL